MRIVIVEDHMMFLDVLRKLCMQELRHDVVGETESGVVAVTLAQRLKPDVLLLDLVLPDLDGFSVIDRVKRVSPRTKIIVISGFLDDYTVVQMDRARVHGFLDKNTNQLEALKAALAAIAQGRTYFSPAFLKARTTRIKDPGWFTKLLSQAEMRVLSLVGRGYSNAEIGGELGISPRTAQKHRTNILRKLDLRGTPKLIAFAVQRGFTRRVVDR